MSVGCEARKYRSPRYKLVQFFEKSRDGWKAKCAAAKRKVKALTNSVVALKKSRNRWKALAGQRNAEVARLRRELEAVKTGPRWR